MCDVCSLLDPAWVRPGDPTCGSLWLCTFASQRFLCGPFGCLGVACWPRLSFRWSPEFSPGSMQSINNLQPPHSGVWSSEGCVCRVWGPWEFTPWVSWFLNRTAGVVPAKGLSWPPVVRPLVWFRLLAFLPRVCACMRLGWGRLVTFLSSGSPMDVALRLAFPACWVQGSHSVTSVGPLSFPSGDNLSPSGPGEGSLVRNTRGSYLTVPPSCGEFMVCPGFW